MKTQLDIQQISKKLIKVKVTISCWTGNVQSKSGQRELARNHNADVSDVRANVSLLPKKVQDEIRKHTMGIRSLLKSKSLPFQDGGTRLMVASDYAAMNKELQRKVEAYRIFVYDEIVEKYDELKYMAETRLNGLFEEGKFPTADQIMYKYNCRSFVEPIMSGEDIHIVGLTELEMEDIKQSAVQEYTEQIVNGQKELLNDLQKIISGIVEKVGNKGARYAGAVRNLCDLTESIKKLNFIENDEIDALVDEVKQKFGNIDANMIKESKRVQSQVKEDGKDLLDKLSNIEF